MPFGPDYRGYSRLDLWLLIGMLAIELTQMAILGILLAR